MGNGACTQAEEILVTWECLPLLPPHSHAAFSVTHGHRILVVHGGVQGDSNPAQGSSAGSMTREWERPVTEKPHFHSNQSENTNDQGTLSYPLWMWVEIPMLTNMYAENSDIEAKGKTVPYSSFSFLSSHIHL